MKYGAGSACAFARVSTAASRSAIGTEGFRAASDVIETARGVICPNHPDVPLQWLTERNWFFRLSAYQERLERYFAENPEFVQPEYRRNEMLGFIRGGLEDFSISRERTPGGWGIPFPIAENGESALREDGSWDPEAGVIYVWYDALINYITGAGFPDDMDAFSKWWPADLHVIGLDISRFHCLYWPAMLLAAGVPIPKRVFVHGFLENRGGKLAKSSGNVFDAFAFADEFGVDGARYLLLREAPFEKSSPISAESFAKRFNADLANDLGNLVSRTTTLLEKFSGGRVPEPHEGESERALRARAEKTLTEHDPAATSLHFADALAAIFALVSEGNQHFQRTQPWQLVKDESKGPELEGSLYAGIEAVRLVAYLLYPYTPNISAKICGLLGVIHPEKARWQDVAKWGVLKPGDPVKTGPALFPRLERVAT